MGCAACPERADGIVFALVGVVVGLIALAGIMFKFRALLPVVMLKLCVNYGQGALHLW